MKKLLTPDNEVIRLAGLRSLNLFDPPAHERFDRITRMAQRMFNVPIALVSLVDEQRQWFKSCIGLDALETPRDISFCGHAVSGDGTFVIEDAAKDERFSDNPLVTGPPFIRFYAGCPLSLPGCGQLGTLSVIDTVPREFSAEDSLLMQDLTEMVESEMRALRMATQDELTRLTNRRGLQAVGQHCLEYCARNQLVASLTFIDLNDFKSINDDYGHGIGDAVLETFAKVLQSNLRAVDIAARIGGDEFVCLMIDTPEACAHNVVAKLKKALADSAEREKMPFNIDFSYGVVEWDSTRHHSIEQLLGEADSMMYRFKRQLKGN